MIKDAFIYYVFYYTGDQLFGCIHRQKTDHCCTAQHTLNLVLLIYREYSTLRVGELGRRNPS